MGRKSREKRLRHAPRLPESISSEVVEVEATKVVALRALRKSSNRIQSERRRAAQLVHQAREAGATWSDIGAALEVSRQGARQRFSRATVGSEATGGRQS